MTKIPNTKIFIYKDLLKYPKIGSVYFCTMQFVVNPLPFDRMGPEGHTKMINFDRFYKVFEHRESASRNAYKPNAFQCISALLTQRIPKSAINDRFYKGFATAFCRI